LENNFELCPEKPGQCRRAAREPVGIPSFKHNNTVPAIAEHDSFAELSLRRKKSETNKGGELLRRGQMKSAAVI